MGRKNNEMLKASSKKKSNELFNPVSEWNIIITLIASDTDPSINTISIPKELVEAKIFPRWGRERCKRMLEPDSFVMVDLYEHRSKATSSVAMKKDEHGNFKLYGWHPALGERSFKTGDVIGFWWDKNCDRLNFELLVIAS